MLYFLWSTRIVRKGSADHWAPSKYIKYTFSSRSKSLEPTEESSTGAQGPNWRHSTDARYRGPLGVNALLGRGKQPSPGDCTKPRSATPSIDTTPSPKERRQEAHHTPSLADDRMSWKENPRGEKAGGSWAVAALMSLHQPADDCGL